MQGLPERVLAPQRRLERIGPVLRGCLAFILLLAPYGYRRAGRAFNDGHRWLLRDGEGLRLNLGLWRRRRRCRLGHVAENRLSTFSYCNVLDRDFLLAASSVALERIICIVKVRVSLLNARSAASCCGRLSIRGKCCRNFIVVI